MKPRSRRAGRSALDCLFALPALPGVAQAWQVNVRVHGLMTFKVRKGKAPRGGEYRCRRPGAKETTACPAA